MRAQRVIAFYDGRTIPDAPPAVALADPEVKRHVVGTREGVERTSA